jgi:mevalonate kinase
MHSIAPGKIILCGEHAVVYASPALVMAVNRHAHCRIQSNDDNIHLSLKDLDVHFSLQVKDLAKVTSHIRQRFDSFLKNKVPIRNVLQNPQDLYLLALDTFHQHHGLKSGLDLEIYSDLMIGSGMGSSAATLASLYHALYTTFDLSVELDDIYALTLETEHFQHGNPSGIDPYIATFGGFIRFEDRKPVVLDILPPKFHLIYTGSPSSTTGECVMAVKKFSNSDIWQSFTDTTNLFEHAIKSGQYRLLIKAVKDNHRLLDEIGVVPARINKFICNIEHKGGAAKISGAGCIKGPHAGLVIAFMDTDPQELCHEFGYQFITITGEPHGVRTACRNCTG